ncbi:phospholipase D-like domain-containing protein [Mycolicibacterium confluentis]|uniref:Phospholipase D/transphosphatidylase n=1 Tax=Mycolicibacterium confluentis TaxID=28047 RepID=A0A7I7Y3K8_9MYCO|nr:phospholipase D-like domain-containing protein [Mycolicibacterium confluentis]MCV7318267.1 phospholipase [Mycolicibacterium confluentis]ORV29592.1 phospholipase [Mycolicibacterium confluentis]BBZ36179.1 phospholipase D/transphosphatidylase [Mycolicibacterium confluentis]
MPDDRVLVPGHTCWRVERAERFAHIVDGADYFRHVKAALLRARRRIILIGWDFDSRTTLERGDRTLAGPNQLGALLYWLLWKRAALDVHVLKSNLRLLPAFGDLWYGLTPVGLVNRLSSSRMHLAVDGAHPTGAVHHQKIVVVDDAVAFCGGIDMTLDRWDTTAHADAGRDRRTLGRGYGPRHEVAVAVDGAAARALAEIARDRWRTATGQALAPLEVAHSTWPRGLDPDLRAVEVGMARTMPRLEPQREIREIEALNLAAIAAARQVIYLENQYLASRTVVDALAARLAEPHGPEVVIVIPRRSESRLEQASMDSARQRLLHRLWEADAHSRLGVYWPVTDGGTPIYVHSKVLVIDDVLLRVGSSNLNNRSMGFDSECDVAIEAAHDSSAGEDVRTVVRSVRRGLVCEHLGVTVDEFEQRVREGASFLRAIEDLRGEGRTLRPFTEDIVAGEASPLAENELMDPDRVPRSLTSALRRLITGLTR